MISSEFKKKKKKGSRLLVLSLILGAPKQAMAVTCPSVVAVDADISHCYGAPTAGLPSQTCFQTRLLSSESDLCRLEGCMTSSEIRERRGLSLQSAGLES